MGTGLATVREMSGAHLTLGVCRSDVQLPLGWVLSASARQEMQRQIDEPCAPRNNPTVIDSLGSLIR